MLAATPAAARLPWRRWSPLGAFALGTAMPLAFSPYYLWWLPVGLLAALCVLWDGQTPRRAMHIGFAFGVGQFLTGTYWLHISIHEYGGAPLSLALFLTGAVIVIMACYFAVLGWAVARLAPVAGAARWLLLVPGAWVLVEWWRGWFLSGFGWLALGYSQADSVLAGWLPALGVYGASLAVVLSAGALRTLLLPGRARLAAGAVLLLVWLGGAALSRVEWTEAREHPVSFALLQGAVPQDLKWAPEQLPHTLELYRALTAEALGHDLIIWPEAALPVLAHEVPEYLDGIRAMAQEAGSEVVMGILRYNFDSRQYENTLMAVREEPLVYLKRHLVPFGEYFPVPARVREWMRLLSLPYTDIAAGEPGQPAWDLAGERLALSICYEDLFGVQQLHYYPDATLLVNASNDAWFGDSIAPHQHLQIARTRAIEGRRTMLRATNTGVSAVIDPWGRVTDRSPQFETDTLTGEVHGRHGYTPYARWANWPVVGGSLLLLLLGWRGGRREGVEGAAASAAAASGRRDPVQAPH